MKNLILFIVFALTSALLLVVMLVLAVLPKICSCFNTFCNKNHAKLALQKERANMIRQARLKLAYQAQIMHEAPGNEVLDLSRGIFLDEDTQQKNIDEVSLRLYKKMLDQDQPLQSRLNLRLAGLNPNIPAD